MLNRQKPSDRYDHNPRTDMYYAHGVVFKDWESITPEEAIEMYWDKARHVLKKSSLYLINKREWKI